MENKNIKLGRCFFYFFFIMAIVLVGLAITGCSKCQECNSQTEIVVNTEIVEVNVPVGCQFPNINCDLSGEDFEVTEKMLKCIKLQKDLIEKCKSDITKWKE